MVTLGHSMDIREQSALVMVDLFMAAKSLIVTQQTAKVPRVDQEGPPVLPCEVLVASFLKPDTSDNMSFPTSFCNQFQEFMTNEDNNNNCHCWATGVLSNLGKNCLMVRTMFSPPEKKKEKKV